MDRNLINREVKIGEKEGEITNILGCGYEVTFFNTNDGKTWVDAKDIEGCLVPECCDKNNEHPVWKILNKDKYVEEFYQQAESMYDFIKGIVTVCGNTTKDGNTVPTMKVFFDMWNEFSGETFWILSELVNKKRQNSF